LSGVFVSYRAADSATHAATIRRELAAQFGDDQVFLDLTRIKWGEHYPSTIRDALLQADVLVVVVSPRWLQVMDAKTGQRRIDQERDWVRYEIRTAFARGIPVFPVQLANEARDLHIPAAADLPPDIARLAHLQWMKIAPERLDDSMAELGAAIRSKVPGLPDLRASQGRAARRATALAGLAVLSLAVTAVVWAVTGWPDSDEGSLPGPTTTVTGSGTVTSNSPTTSPAIVPGPEQWRGDLAIQSGGVDLDQVPPVKDASDGDLLKTHFTEVSAGRGAAVIAWVGPAAPTAQECQTHVAGTLGDVPVFDPAPGTYLCVRTSEGRLASAQYQGIVDGGLFAFAFTVWDKG